MLLVSKVMFGYYNIETPNVTSLWYHLKYKGMSTLVGI